MTMTFIKTPKGYLLVILLLLAVVASFHTGAAAGWINIGAAVLAAVLIDFGFALVQQRSRIFPDGAVLTGLIVALVLSSTVPWYQCVVTVQIALLSKHLLKIKRRPIFNPAAFGLMAAILLFGAGQDWWGALSLLPGWFIALMLIAGMVMTERVNKFPQVLSFLGVYTILFLIGGLLHMETAADALRTPFIHAALFLAMFMVTDPPTSPAKYTEQVVFGATAALISVLDYLIWGGLSYLLVGLLVMNGWYAWRTFAAHKAVTAAA